MNVSKKTKDIFSTILLALACIFAISFLISAAGNKKNCSEVTPEAFVEQAKKYLGIPYLYGGTTKKGMDCSGLVYTAAKECGMGTVEKTSRSLKQSTYNVTRENLRIGDLVFFERNSSIFHVAIYIGENKIIHAVSDGPTTGVLISSMDEKFWKEHYHSCGRFPIFMD